MSPPYSFRRHGLLPGGVRSLAEQDGDWLAVARYSNLPMPPFDDINQLTELCLHL
jgi:hypothetical protein